MFPFTLHQLRILRAVATEQSFTKAAEMLYLSQPSLSKQLKILEASLNISLINRKKNQPFLTENGKIFLRYTDRILALCEESCRIVNESRNQERGILTIGAPQILAMDLFPKISVFLTQKYPGITFNFKAFSTVLLLKQIQQETIDIAILDEELLFCLKKLKSKQKLLLTPFVSIPLNLIVSKSHPVAAYQKIPKAALYSLDYISLNDNIFEKKKIDTLLTSFQIDSARLKIIMKLNSIEKIKQAVNLGLGSAFVPMSSVYREAYFKFTNTKLIQIKDFQLTQKFYVINIKNREKLEVYRLICQELKKL